jgi:flagellar biosynthesis protein FliQ
LTALILLKKKSRRLCNECAWEIVAVVTDLTPDLTLALAAKTFWTAALLLAPLIGATALVGLVISVLQGVTQIQEASLTFVPKLITAGVILVGLGGWMLKVMCDFAISLISNIPNYF